MKKINIQKMIALWIDCYEEEGKAKYSEEHDWAFDSFYDICREDPELALQSIEKACFATTNENVLANLAAGPLEDLLSMHGEKIIDEIESIARKNSRFKQLLRGVWQNAMSDVIWERVKFLAGSSKYKLK